MGLSMSEYCMILVRRRYNFESKPEDKTLPEFADE